MIPQLNLFRLKKALEVSDLGEKSHATEQSFLRTTYGAETPNDGEIGVTPSSNNTRHFLPLSPPWNSDIYTTQTECKTVIPDYLSAVLWRHCLWKRRVFLDKTEDPWGV